MQQEFIHRLFAVHQQSFANIPKSAISKLTEGVLELLFPQLSEQRFKSQEELALFAKALRNELMRILLDLEPRLSRPAKTVASDFMDKLQDIYDTLLLDAEAIGTGDPAAYNVNEVIRTYPGFLAIAVYRLAHALYQLEVPLLPRVLSEYAHSKTGIDIHPGAIIGPHFCIDHGTGIVIGQTTLIGRHVKVYQGVTLGALSVEKYMARMKRHPTIEDQVVIYAGATILGGSTTIGNNSVIGGNVWLTQSVPPYSRVYHKAQIKVSKSDDPVEGIHFSI
jgi:serine O-acetyltransferase